MPGLQERKVVLLRGVNVGPHHRIRMPDLTAHLQALGCADVVTYVQSGNAVVTDRRSPDEVARAVAARLAEHGLPVPVMVRDGEQWQAVVAGLPWEVTVDKLLHVACADGPVDPALLPDPADVAPDRVAAGPADVLYLDYTRSSVRSPLEKPLAPRRIGVQLTARNWRTVLALDALVRDGQTPTALKPPST